MKVSLEKGNTTPLWLLLLRVIWFVLSNVVRVAAAPFGYIYFGLGKGVYFVNRRLYQGFGSSKERHV